MDSKQWGEPCEIVKISSEGAMLRGVILGMDVNDITNYRVARQRLVEVPTGLVLRGPTFTLKTENTKLNSKTESSAFEESIDNTEISLGAKVKFKGILEWAGLGIEGQRTKINEQQKSTQTDMKFFSEVNTKIFAVASLQFEKQHLNLSSEAKKELESIKIANMEQKQSLEKRRRLYHLCSSFFECFGSHVNLGVFQFGGILTTTSTFEGETKSDIEDIKTVVSKRLEAQVEAGYGGIGAAFSAKIMKDQGKLNKNFDEKVVDKIQVVHKQYGGRTITKQFTEDKWLNNLREDSTDWVIIDRGDSRSSDHVGVWDLLPKELESIHQTLYGFFSTFFYRNQILRILNTRNNLESIRNALKEIQNITKNRSKENDVITEWHHILLDDENVSQFLLTPEKHLASLKRVDLEEIAATLEQLLDYVKSNDFPNRKEVHDLIIAIKERTEKRKICDKKGVISEFCVII